MRSFDDAAKVRRLAGAIWRCERISVDEWLRKVRGGFKWCSGCRAWHALDHFYEDTKQPDALKGPCRVKILAKLEAKRIADRKSATA